MKLPLFQFSAFTKKQFAGNPAAVCVLHEWLDADTMQSIATENNLSETAFFVGDNGDYELRWFTPEIEIDLCGHATLAAAYLVFDQLEPDTNEVRFQTQSGTLTVTRDGDLLSMLFPSRAPEPTEIPATLAEALGSNPVEVLQSRDLMVVLADEQEVSNLTPDLDKLAEIDSSFAIIVTALGEEVDFVSRFFAPRAGIPEDPVTGSAHCTLIPFWAERLGKTQLSARQVSKRGGELFCEDLGQQVRISGYVTAYSEGYLFLDS